MSIFTQPLKKVLSICLWSLCVSSFNASAAQVSAEPSSEAAHAEHSMNWPGIYYGYLPCEDCNGLKTTLALNKNNSYILITQYVGKSPREYVEKGKFIWSDKHNTIILNAKNGTDKHYYYVDENGLVQLDNHGERIAGKDADRYHLVRTEVTKNPPEQHGMH